MAKDKSRTPAWWYPANIIVGLAAAYYVRFHGTETGKSQAQSYGVVALVSGIVLVIAGMKQKRRNLAPIGVGAIAYGLATLFI